MPSSNPGRCLQDSRAPRAEPFLEGQPLAHLHRRGAMIQACEKQLHGVQRRASIPTCAAQVSAAHPSTSSAITAAFRPAPAGGGPQKNHHQAQQPGEKGKQDFRVADPRVPDSIDAQVIAKITPSVSSTKPSPMEIADQVVERRQRRQFFEQRAAALALEPPLLDQIEDASDRGQQQRRVIRPAPARYGRSARRRARPRSARSPPAAPSPATSVIRNTSGNKATAVPAKVVAPFHQQEHQGDQKRAQAERFKEVVERQAAVGHGQLPPARQRAAPRRRETRQRHRIQLLIAPHDRQHGVQQARAHTGRPRRGATKMLEYFHVLRFYAG